MMTLTMSPAQTWATLGSLFFIVGGLLWIIMIAGAEAAKAAKSAKAVNTATSEAVVSEAETSGATTQVEDLGASTQTGVTPITAERVLAALNTLDDPRDARDHRGTYLKPNTSDTAAAALPVRRPLRAVAQPAKRPHLSIVPPLVSTTRRSDRTPVKVYDWSRHGL